MSISSPNAPFFIIRRDYKLLLNEPLFQSFKEILIKPQ